MPSKVSASSPIDIRLVMGFCCFKIILYFTRIFIREAEICQCKMVSTNAICSSYKKQITVRGCLNHSHPIEKRNLRLSKVVKREAADLLKAGIQPKVVLNKYFPPDECSQSKPVTSGDIYRIANDLNLNGEYLFTLSNNSLGLPVTNIY